ncbi:MAG: DUF63 family protein [Methanomicrobiales archaeon]|nr:DUF63 family protein [Methanomicrobiales archaeon]
MIREFLYKYYIDPIVLGQPYNPVDTLTYALILLVAVYLISRWLVRAGIPVDRDLVLSTLPYVVLGGLLRVVEDTALVPPPWQYLLITPLIFFVVFGFTVAVLFLSRFLQEKGVVPRYHPLYAGVGAGACVGVGLLLLWFGLTYTQVDLLILSAILGLALATSLAIMLLLERGFGWQFAADPLYRVLIFAQMLDASATSIGIDLHPLRYVEVHVVGSTLIALTGTAFSMFLLKIVVVIPAIYILTAYRKEGNPALWHLILLAMIVVGLAPGVRDTARMVLYV